MNISEDTLNSWAKGPGSTEAEKCSRAEKAVKDAIANDNALAKLNISVFPQGSYKARTNVPRDSDVDICIRHNDIFIAEYPEGQGHEDFGNSSADLSYATFRNMVEVALKTYLGAEHVSRGSKAFDIRANTYRLDADVVTTFEHRRYTGRTTSYGLHEYLSGVAFYSDSGDYIKNWPEQNYANGVSKNNTCNCHYKRVIRILKRLCYQMQDDAISQAKGIPSFLIESLVWNVPNNAFAHYSYREDVREVLAHIFNNTQDSDRCAEWAEVNELKYLFHWTQNWTVDQAHQFVGKAWDYLGFE